VREREREREKEIGTCCYVRDRRYCCYEVRPWKYTERERDGERECVCERERNSLLSASQTLLLL